MSEPTSQKVVPMKPKAKPATRPARNRAERRHPQPAEAPLTVDECKVVATIVQQVAELKGVLLTAVGRGGLSNGVFKLEITGARMVFDEEATAQAMQQQGRQ